jgi:hypothetical protein
MKQFFCLGILLFSFSCELPWEEDTGDFSTSDLAGTWTIEIPDSNDELEVIGQVVFSAEGNDLLHFYDIDGVDIFDFYSGYDSYDSPFHDSYDNVETYSSVTSDGEVQIGIDIFIKDDFDGDLINDNIFININMEGQMNKDKNSIDGVSTSETFVDEELIVFEEPVLPVVFVLTKG